jgi:hypothetical protein
MTSSVTAQNSPPVAARRPIDEKIAMWFGLVLSLALSVAWIVLHVRFFLHAGALWRDEVNSVDLCNSPSLGDTWHNLQYDSFPMLWHLLLRAWIRSGIGSSDRGIRVLGLIVGLAILAVIWINARRFRIGWPIVALGLLGFSTAVICDGDSVRGYGLGMLLELTTLGLMWEVAVRLNAWRFAAALVAALASVHLLFYNSVILGAICCGGIAVAVSHCRWKNAAAVAVIGVICAASVSIYAPAIHRANSFRMILVHEPSVRWLGSKFAEAVGYDSDIYGGGVSRNYVFWGITLMVGLLAGAVSLARARPADDKERFRRDVIVYHLAVLCAGLLGYWWFLTRLSYVMQPWYYLALMALVAVCVDALIASYPRALLRLVAGIAILGFCISSARPVWTDAGLRKTGIDYDGQELARMTKSGDLVVISPWYLGVTFQRYFHGPADWLVIPPMKIINYHNYDQLVAPMEDVHAMDPVLQRIAQTLRAGHVVFLMGDFDYPGSDLKYPTMNAAPNNSWGWNDAFYYDTWERQICFFVSRHCTQATPVFAQIVGVSGYEKPTLLAARGWKESLDQQLTGPDSRP